MNYTYSCSTGHEPIGYSGEDGCPLCKLVEAIHIHNRRQQVSPFFIRDFDLELWSKVK